MSEINTDLSWPGWETVRLIGRGSFGAVYEIERDVLGEKEKAALKVITIPQSDSDISEMVSDGYDEESITVTVKEHLKSIVAEYSLMRKLNSSANIVSCDDLRYIQHDNGVGWDIYIKMELLTPLTAVLPQEIPPELTINVAKDICRALQQCRQFDIVHRDIKPQNIFVSPLGSYKLGDFGTAKLMEKTSGGTKTGTYKYMAPEVYNNKPYGHSADIYSLGLVLYWMLNERRMPFMPLPPAKMNASLEESSRQRRFFGEPIPAPAHGDPALQAIILKACAYDPKDRYQSAAEMMHDLEKLGNTQASAPYRGHTANASLTREGKEPLLDENTIGGPAWQKNSSGTAKEEPYPGKTPRYAPPYRPGADADDEKTIGAFRSPAVKKHAEQPEKERVIEAVPPQAPPDPIKPIADKPEPKPSEAGKAQKKRKVPIWVPIVIGALVLAAVVVLAVFTPWKKAPEIATPVLRLEEASRKGATLCWTEIKGATKYLLQRSEDERTWQDIASPAVTQYTDVTVQMGSEYHYRVSADLGETWSDRSEELTVLFNPFTDVEPSGKLFRIMCWAYNHGIDRGTSDVSFSPDDGCTRKQFILMLWRLNGSTEVSGTLSYADVKDKELEKALLWAVDRGLVRGEKKFHGNTNIRRAQIIMILWKMAGSPKESGDFPFTDVIGEETRNAVLWAYQNGITKGRSDDPSLFDPDADCTRIQLVTFLYNYNKKYHII